MPGRERHLPAGHTADRQAEGSTEGNGLRLGIVRVYDVEPLLRYIAAELSGGSERYHF